MRNYYKLNLPFNVEDIDLDKMEEFKESKGMHLYTQTDRHVTHILDNPTQYISKRLSKFLEKYDYSILFFYCPRGRRTTNHYDGDFNNIISFAINIPWNSQNAIMSWYSINEGETRQIGFTTAKTPFVYYKDNQVTLIEQVELNSITLVRTDIIHRLVNLDQYNDRHCISIRIKDIKTWEDAVNEFRDYIIE